MRSKLVKVIDVNGKTYEYNGVKIACEECPLPVWYGIYPHRRVSKTFEEDFEKIALVKVGDTIRYERNSADTEYKEKTSMNIVEKFASFLEGEEILPIENWTSFKILHCTPENLQDKKGKFKYIKDKVGNKEGIYIYVKGGEVLYIGKGKPLYKRIKDHYVESFKPIPDGAYSKNSRWDRFFSEHSGELEVYWKEFDTEEGRQIIEFILTKLLKPKFLKFK